MEDDDFCRRAPIDGNGRADGELGDVLPVERVILCQRSGTVIPRISTSSGGGVQIQAVGLDLPYSCRGGVCCTCRAKVLEGQVQMDRNFTLEAWETDKGFVLSCQARPTSERLVVSYDER